MAIEREEDYLTREEYFMLQMGDELKIIGTKEDLFDWRLNIELASRTINESKGRIIVTSIINLQQYGEIQFRFVGKLCDQTKWYLWDDSPRHKLHPWDVLDHWMGP